MKLKRMLLAGLLIIPLFSCEKRDETDTVEITTDLIVDIDVSSTIGDAPVLKSSVTEDGYTFSGSGIFCLAENKDLGKTVCQIKSVKPGTACILTFSGVTNETRIYSLLLKWDSKAKDSGEFEMDNEIDITELMKGQNNGSLEIDLTSVILPMVNCIDSNPDCMYRIDLHGISNFEISTTAKLVIPLVVETNFYSTRFTLF